MTTNRASSPTDAGTSDDLRAEYDLARLPSRPNRFASAMSGTVVAVTLEPDVAAVFDTSDAVNRARRAVITARSADDPDAGRAGPRPGS